MLDTVRILEVLASIFAMHCMLMDCSPYYRNIINNLTAKREKVRPNNRAVADIEDAMREAGL